MLALGLPPGLKPVQDILNPLPGDIPGLPNGLVLSFQHPFPLCRGWRPLFQDPFCPLLGLASFSCRAPTFLTHASCGHSCTSCHRIYSRVPLRVTQISQKGAIGPLCTCLYLVGLHYLCPKSNGFSGLVGLWRFFAKEHGQSGLLCFLEGGRLPTLTPYTSLSFGRLLRFD